MKSVGCRRDRSDFSPSCHWRLGCPEGYHLPFDGKMRDIRLVVPVPDVTHVQPPPVMIGEVGNFCALCTDLGPWVRLEHLLRESVCPPLLRLTLGRRTVLREWTIVALLSEKLESCASGSLVGGCGECDTLEQQT